MARRKQSDNQGSEDIKPRAILPDWLPASPHRPTTHAVYCSYPADAPAGERRQIVITFAAAYAAKHFVDQMLGFGEYTWMAAPKWDKDRIPDTIKGANNVLIRVPGGDILERLLDHQFTAAEEAWQLPDRYAQQCALIRREPGAEDEVDEETGEPKPPRVKREKVERVKIDRTGLVSVGEIAEQMGIEARDARAALRKQKVDKPTGGWLWSADQVDGIKATIKKGLK